PPEHPCRSPETHDSALGSRDRLRRSDGRFERDHAGGVPGDDRISIVLPPGLSRTRPSPASGEGSLVAYRAAAAVGSVKSLKRSRSTVFWIFPVAVCGISSTNTPSSGIHQLGILPRMNFKSSSLVADWSFLSTMTSSGRSSHLGCCTPITAASATLGWPTAR